MLNLFKKYSISNYNAKAIQEGIKNFVSENEIGFGRIMMPLRLALVGGLHGPDIPVIMEILGKEETEKRLNSFIAFGEKS